MQEPQIAQTGTAAAITAQIHELEQKEEQRVTSALAAFAAQRKEQDRSFAEELATVDRDLRAVASEELRAFATAEPAGILEKAATQTSEQVQGLDGFFKTKAPSLAKKLVKELQTFSFVS